MSNPHMSSRRFDIGSHSQPVVQFVAASFPFFILLLWFLVDSHLRSTKSCYNESSYSVDDDNALQDLQKECSDLVPLQQYLWVYLGALFGWGFLAVYLTFYIPRRHALVEVFLTDGITIVGDVYYNDNKTIGAAINLTATATVVYTHPDTNTPRQICRKVYVYERYTRESTVLVVLPGQPFSAQPKMDLEIDRDVSLMNQERIGILTMYSWAWVGFCLLAPLYILNVLSDLNNGDLDQIAQSKSVWQPDTSIGNLATVFYLLSFAVAPVVCGTVVMASWQMHKRWMTQQHRELKEGESVEAPHSNLCYLADDAYNNIEATEYIPPTSTKSEQGIME